MGKIQWIQSSPEAYSALVTKNSDALYFLTNGQIYKGSQPFTQSVIMVDSFPDEASVGALGKLYVHSTTLEGKTYTATGWKRVIEPVVTTLDGTVQDGVANAEAVKAYVLSQISASTVGVTDVAFDETTKVLKVTDGGVVKDVEVDGLVTGATYAGGILTINLTGMSPVEINFPADNFVTSGTYDTVNKKIVLTLKDASIVEIPAADLVDIYTGITSSTADVSIVNNEVKVDVKVSNTVGNKLATDANGLFVSNTIVETGKAGEVLVANADGTGAASGVKVGSTTLSGTPDGMTLATEAAVNAIKTALQANITNLVVTSIRDTASASDTVVASEKAVATALATKVDKTDVVATINVEAPSTTKVASEAAVVELASWTVLA